RGGRSCGELLGRAGRGGGAGRVGRAGQVQEGVVQRGVGDPQLVGGDAGAGQQGDDGVDGRVGAGQRDAVVAVLGRGQAGQRGEVGLVQRRGRGEADDGGAGRAADEPGRGVQGGHPSPA